MFSKMGEVPFILVAYEDLIDEWGPMHPLRPLIKSPTALCKQTNKSKALAAAFPDKNGPVRNAYFCNI